MPFWCIDPTNGNDTTGASQTTQSAAEATPYKTLDAIEAEGTPPAAGDSILFKGGDLLQGIQTVTVSGSAGSVITYGSYGTGRGGVDANGDLSAITNDSKTYLTFDNIELKNAEGSGNQNLLLTAATVATEVNVIVDGCKIHGGGDDDGGGDNQGIDIRASQVQVYDSEIYDLFDDGLYIEGNDVEVHHNYIHDVDKSAGTKSGDCCKFSSSGACTDNHAHHNIFDSTSNRRKQALIMAGSGAGQLGEHNKCLGGEICINLKTGTAGIARKNLCETSKPGTYNGVAITETAGIRVEGSGQTVESNIIHSKSDQAMNYGIWASGDTDAIQGNVIYGDLTANGSNTEAMIRGSGSRTYTAIRNNIIGGQSNGFHLYLPTTSTVTYCDYNIYLQDGKFHLNGTTYANLAAWQATGHDTNSVIVSAETLFRDPANGDFRINTGQEVTGVQLYYKDFLGRVNFPTIIGAYIQADDVLSSAGAVTDTAGTVDTTGGTVLGGSRVGGTSVYGDSAKYPTWGVRT